MKRAILLTALISLPAFAEEKKVVRGHVFAWPFTEVAEMQPRGGSTQGTTVVLDEAPSLNWERLQIDSSSEYVKDLHAIVALSGSYRVSFDFIETMGFRQGYTPPKPYFSWGTEHVQVLALQANFVSLQHSLVMYFKDENGKESGPMVMKHWRQDWTYEDTDLHSYQGDSTWTRETKSPEEVKGRWTQAVFQVDDSPRYEVVGEWRHEGGMSTWKSESCWRPLPRREFSVRDDYQILQGVHELTITPSGWVHTQQNQKLALGEKGANKIVGQELGVNRYERITEPSLMAAETTLEKSGDYWREVREMWAEVFAQNETFSLKSKVDEKKLYQYHFGYAMELEGSDEAYDAVKGRAHARETIARFLEVKSGRKSSKY
ncbi:MAG: hypothetical protein ACI8UZ_002021 [Akkermansiaceae bacterium]|jgi:hypothetical protein